MLLGALQSAQSRERFSRPVRSCVGVNPRSSRAREMWTTMTRVVIGRWLMNEFRAAVREVDDQFSQFKNRELARIAEIDGAVERLLTAARRCLRPGRRRSRMATLRAIAVDRNGWFVGVAIKLLATRPSSRAIRGPYVLNNLQIGIESPTSTHVVERVSAQRLPSS